jgi:hypothetical protein
MQSTDAFLDRGTQRDVERRVDVGVVDVAAVRTREILAAPGA